MSGFGLDVMGVEVVFGAAGGTFLIAVFDDVCPNG